MERLTGHHELQELLGAYALDAVDPEEAAAIEHHLSTCPRCRAELAEHREVAALLGYAGAPAPAGVWDRIVASLEEPPPAMRLSQTPLQSVGPDRTPASAPAPPPPPEAPAATRADRAPVIPIGRGRRTMSGRLFVAAATIAAVVIAGLGIEIGRLQTHKQPARLSSVAIQQMLYDYAAANPAARRITLTSADTATKVPAVVLPDGTSVLGKGDLPVLPANETYQLWGIVGAQTVSLRVIGTNPDFVVFTTPPSTTVLAMTIEQQGGVVTSTKKPVVSSLVT